MKPKNELHQATHLKLIHNKACMQNVFIVFLKLSNDGTRRASRGRAFPRGGATTENAHFLVAPSAGLSWPIVVLRQVDTGSKLFRAS